MPQTGWGKVLASIASLSGIVVLAIPITVISTNFKIEFDAHEALRQQDNADNVEELSKEITHLCMSNLKMGVGDSVELQKKEEIQEREELLRRLRIDLACAVDQEIQEIIDLNYSFLMEKIEELINRQRVVMDRQINSVLEKVPTFIEKRGKQTAAAL